jgi:hypothetical protein
MQTPDYYEMLANGIAAHLWEYGGEFSKTGLQPEAISESVLLAIFKSIPQFRDASQEVVDEFSEKLRDAIRNRMQLERNLETVRRQGLKPS